MLYVTGFLSVTGVRKMIRKPFSRQPGYGGERARFFEQMGRSRDYYDLLLSAAEFGQSLLIHGDHRLVIFTYDEQCWSLDGVQRLTG